MSSRFVLATAAQLRPDLSLPEGRNSKARKAALRTAVNNMTLNNPEMLKLYPEVIRCMHSSDTSVKRLSFLFLETYLKSRPQHAADTLEQLSREVCNESSPPSIRGVALRTMSSIPVKAFALEATRLIPDAMDSDDAYLRKTACYAIAKVWLILPHEVENSQLIARLNQALVRERSPLVVAAAVQSLLSITDHTSRLQFVVDASVVKRLAAFLGESPDSCHVAILAVIMRFVPQQESEADALIHQILPGIRHSNTAVAMGSARALLMLAHYSSSKQTEAIPQQVLTRLLPQLNKPPEIQYAVLRNIYLLLQSIDENCLAHIDIPAETFFFRARDVPYIRATKIDILVQLCTEHSALTIVTELGEFVQAKQDMMSRKRAILALGKLCIRFENVVPECVDKLANVVEDEPEAVTALVDIARRYPTNAHLLNFIRKRVLKVRAPVADEPRRSYYWIASTATEEPELSLQIYEKAVAEFSNEKPAVQVVILTGCVRLFLRFGGTKLVPAVLQIATETSLDPDVRDRAFFYLRLLQSCAPARALGIVSPGVPPIVAAATNLDENQLEDLELSLGYISSLYLKPGNQLFRQARVSQLGASPALKPRAHNAATAAVSASAVEHGLPLNPTGGGPLFIAGTPTLEQLGSPTFGGHIFDTPTSQSSGQRMMSPSPQKFPSPMRSTSYIARQPSGIPSQQTGTTSLLNQDTGSSSLMDSQPNLPKPQAPRSRTASDSPPVEAGLTNLSLEQTPTGEQSVRLIDI